MGRPSAAQLIPLMSKLGGYFKEGIDHYAMLKASGLEAKEAASRLLAGIVYNLSSTSPQS